MYQKSEIPKPKKEIWSSVQKGLSEIAKATVESSKKIFSWFSEFFKAKKKDIKEKGFIMGAFAGFLNNVLGFGKEKEEKKEEKGKEEEKKEAPVAAAEARANLKKDVEKKRKAEAPKPFDQTAIKSNPYEKPGKNTLCSKTAKLNLEMLFRKAGVFDKKIFKPIRRGRNAKVDIQKIRDEAAAEKYNLKDVIPTGNADEIEQFYLETHARIIRGNTKEKIHQLNLTGKTVCDIVTFGSTMYGHRSVGFKGIDGNWYVLDPYRYRKRKDPISFEEYEKKFGADIKFVIPIDTSGQMSALEVAEETTKRGKEIIKAVGEAITEGIIGKNCWDWVDKVYRIAGFPKGKREELFSSVPDYTGYNCGKHHASQEYVKKTLKPGDWLFINNRNTIWTHPLRNMGSGNHSVIFLGWADKSNLIARTASCLRGGKPGTIENRSNFKKYPVTKIKRPVG